MIHNVRRWVASGLGLFLIALILFGLPGFASRLECELVRPRETERPSAQSRLSLSFVGAQQRRASKARAPGRIAELFRNNCARCHGADGRGDTPLGHTYKAPDFTDPDWWRKHSDITSARSLIAIVTRGKGGMPAFGKKLKRSDIPLLVKYVRRFRNQN
jgi:mono/diheme cytochrome c family protein